MYPVKFKQYQKGFTLIELVFVIMLISIISVVVGQSLFHAYQTFFTSQSITEVDWQGFAVLEKMVNDIHTIRRSTDIQLAQPSQLTFINLNGQTIQYQLSGTTLLRNSIQVATGIQSLNLSYFDKNGTTTSTPSLIRYISIAPNISQGNINTTFETLGALRNTL